MTVTVTLRDGGTDKYMRFGDGDEKRFKRHFFRS